jgi:hypothetical protein
LPILAPVGHINHQRVVETGTAHGSNGTCRKCRVSNKLKMKYNLFLIVSLLIKALPIFPTLFLFYNFVKAGTIGLKFILTDLLI